MWTSQDSGAVAAGRDATLWTWRRWFDSSPRNWSGAIPRGGGAPEDVKWGEGSDPRGRGRRDHEPIRDDPPEAARGRGVALRLRPRRGRGRGPARRVRAAPRGGRPAPRPGGRRGGVVSAAPAEPCHPRGERTTGQPEDDRAPGRGESAGDREP